MLSTESDKFDIEASGTRGCMQITSPNSHFRLNYLLPLDAIKLCNSLSVPREEVFT